MKSPEQIIAAVAGITGVPVAAITGKRRSRRILHARYLAIAVVRDTHDWWTLQMTGEVFHVSHHSIIHALRRHRDLLTDTPAYRQMAEQLTENFAPA